MMPWFVGVCGRPLTTRLALRGGALCRHGLALLRRRGLGLGFCLGRGLGLWRCLRRGLLAGHRLCDGRRCGRRLCFGCVFLGRCLLRRLLVGIGADDLRLRLRLRLRCLADGRRARLCLCSSASPRFSASGLVATRKMEDVVVMSGSSVTCFTSSGGLRLECRRRHQRCGKRLRRKRIDPGSAPARQGSRSVAACRRAEPRWAAPWRVSPRPPAWLARSGARRAKLQPSAGPRWSQGRPRASAKPVRVGALRHRSPEARCRQAPAA